MEKKNPTKMDTSEKEKGDATIKKKGDPKEARGKRGKKTLKTLEKTPSVRTDRPPGGQQRKEKSFQT